MKAVFVIISLILSGLFSFAEEPDIKRYQCVSELPTTSYFLNVNGDMTTFALIHHNGMDYAPLHKGVITSSDLKYISKSDEYTRKMGQKIELTFKTSECSRLKSGNISCFHSQKTQIGQLEVDDFYILIYNNTTSNIFGNFKETNARFQYRVNGRNREIPMTFEARDCFSY